MKFEDFISKIGDNLYNEFSSIGSIWNEHLEAEDAYDSWRNQLDLDDEEELTPTKRVELLKGLYESLGDSLEEGFDNMPMGDGEIWEIFDENRDACESAFSDYFSLGDFDSIGNALHESVRVFLEKQVDERIYNMREIVWDMILKVESNDL